MEFRKTRTSLCLTAAGMALLTAMPAVADDKGLALGEVVVTARRMEERLQDVPISITVFNQQQIAARNITNPAELATYVPSLAINSRWGPEKSTFAIRGFIQDQNTAPSVGTYFADVVAPRGAGTSSGGNGAGPGSLFDLQNVQVLKGPQGTLFGRNTTGGAVLLVPARPTDRLEGYIEGSAGNYDMHRVQAVVNVPISENLRTRFGVDRFRRDGFMRNSSGVGPKDFSDSDYWAFRASLVWNLTPDLETYLVGTFMKSDTNGPALRLAACDRLNLLTGLAPFYRAAACAQIDRQNARGDKLWDIENNARNPGQEIEQWQIIDTTTWQVNDNLKVKNIVSYGQYRDRVGLSLVGDNFGPSLPPFVQLFPAADYDSTAQWTFTEEFQLQGELDRLTWQAGVYFEKSKPLGASGGFSATALNCTDALRFQCSDPIGASLGRGVADVRLGSITNTWTKTTFTNKGIYAQATYDLTSQFSITGGIRYTTDEMRVLTKGRRIQFPSVPAGRAPVFLCGDSRIPGDATNRDVCTREFVAKSKKPTWLLGLDYKPTPDTLIYGKYARGYRAGGVNTTNYGLEAWGPEKVDSFEIGAKTSLSSPVALVLNVAAFYNDLTAQQLQATLAAKPGSGLTGGAAIVNAGKSTMKGFEVEGSITPFGPLQIDFSYTYLDASLKSIVLPTLDPNGPFSTISPSSKAGRLNYSPKHRYNVTTTYTLPVSEDVGRISVSATFIHTGEQIASVSTPIGLFAPTDLVNLNADWRNVFGRPVDFSLFATNVTNKAYPLGVGNFFGPVGADSYMIAQPRMVGARLRYRFGS